MKRAIAIFCLVNLVACSAAPIDDRYYSLALDGIDGKEENAKHVEPMSLYIEVIELPEFLRVRNMVIQKGSNEILLARHHFWAEPLENSIRSILSREFESSVGVNVVRGSEQSSTCSLLIAFSRFHPSDSSQLWVTGTFTVASSQGQRSRRFDHSRGLTGDGYSSAVTDLREALIVLSREITASLREQDCIPFDRSR